MTTKKQTTEQPKEAKPPKNGLSISALAEKFDIADRSTVRKRLKGVKPAYVASKLKLYRLTDKGKDGRTVKELLEAEEDSPQLTEARTRKILASARREERKLELEEGNYFARAEVKQHMFQFVSAMFKRFVKINPKQSAPRLFKSRSVAELQRQMETDAELIFAELKKDYPALL